MGLAEDIRDRVRRGLLPPGVPAKIYVLFGDGEPCSACGGQQGNGATAQMGSVTVSGQTVTSCALGNATAD
jgi:hypothetical protein